MDLTAAWQELASYSWLEIAAVAASLLYIVWAAAENRWCWPAAFLGSALFVFIFWRYQLLMDSALNVYYALMAVYGWIVWNKKNNLKDASHGIICWPFQYHFAAIAAVIALSIISGYWLSQHSEASFPYLDSFTTWASLLATWMIAQKMLENWLYWIVIDFISIYLYFNKALYFTVLLSFVYIVLSIYGYYSWQKKRQPQRANAC
jgi:nicotinamide mononucleotide transporter